MPSTVQGFHPDPEDLLLYGSGELPADQQRLIAGHLASCPECHERMLGSEAILRLVAQAQSAPSVRPPVPAVAPTPVRWFTGWRLARGAAVTTAGICVALFLMSDTTSARVDTFLAQRTRRESETRRPVRRYLRVRIGAARCLTLSSVFGTAAGARSGGRTGACQVVDSAFRNAGWQQEEALSLDAYQRWRASLRGKSDEIESGGGVTVVSTFTSQGALRKATLWVHTLDDHASAGRFEFEDIGTVDITETEVENPPERPLAVASSAAAPAPDLNTLSQQPSPAPEVLVERIDDTELRVRVALRKLDADANFQTSVERHSGVVTVRGVVRTAARWQAIQEALHAIPGVANMVVTEAEEERTQAPVPWMPNFHFTEAPLAAKQLRKAFPDAAKEQAFADGVLQLVRNLASYAKARDEMCVLIERRKMLSDVSAAQAAADQLRFRIESELKELSRQLTPLVGATGRLQTVLTSAQAMDLYREVYALIYVSDADQPDRLTAVERIHNVLTAPDPPQLGRFPDDF